MPTLLDPVQIGALRLPNRVVMAPLTRCRAEPGHVPGALMAQYYAQRASAGMLIAEATMVEEGNSAFLAEPGIHSEAQVRGWKGVADAVHAAGGRIAVQLWHGGRACHPALNDGRGTVSSTSVPIDGEVMTLTGKQRHVAPRELRDDELPGIVAAFRRGARHAKAAGLDAVELHAANGYLLDQFLRDGCNRRTGPYGGSIANRARLLLECVDACAAEIGADRVGVRLSPLNGYNGMGDSDPVALTAHVARELAARRIAWLHLMRADFSGRHSGDVVTPARAAFAGGLILNMGFSRDEAERTIAAGTADAIAFGVPFIANPDLVERFRTGAPLAAPDQSTFYMGGAKGYVDYPALQPAAH